MQILVHLKFYKNFEIYIISNEGLFPLQIHKDSWINDFVKFKAYPSIEDILKKRLNA